MAIRGKKILLPENLDTKMKELLGPVFKDINLELDKLYEESDGTNIRRSSLTTSHLQRTSVDATVGTSEVGVLHGLGATPSDVIIRMRSDGRVWETKDPDANKVYLQADGASRVCKVICIA